MAPDKSPGRGVVGLAELSSYPIPASYPYRRPSLLLSCLLPQIDHPECKLTGGTGELDLLYGEADFVEGHGGAVPWRYLPGAWSPSGDEFSARPHLWLIMVVEC